MLAKTNDTANHSFMRSIFRAVAGYLDAKEQRPLAAELYKIADDMLPRPDTGYRLERATQQNFEVWRVVNIRSGKPVSQSGSETIRKLREMNEDDFAELSGG